MLVDNRLWSYLDHFNPNLLYKYADVLCGNAASIWWNIDKESDTLEAETEEMLNRLVPNSFEGNMKLRENVYYLIWFVYYYVLECSTLEEALLQNHRDVFHKFHLYTYLKHRNIFLGGSRSIVFLSREKDIPIILEILYNRYSSIEQFECFVRYYNKKNDKRTTLCRQAIELYQSLEGHKFYEETEENK